MMDAVTCKLIASFCIWTYVFIECSNGLPFHGFLTDKLAREVATLHDAEETEPLVREEDLRKLILKKLRFRDIDESSYPDLMDSVVYEESPMSNEKQKRNPEMSNPIYDRLTAMLNNLKTRQLEPKTRMSSLRFGRSLRL